MTTPTIHRVERVYRAVREEDGYVGADWAIGARPEGFRTFVINLMADSRNPRWQSAEWTVEALSVEDAERCAVSCHSREVGFRGVYRVDNGTREACVEYKR